MPNLEQSCIRPGVWTIEGYRVRRVRPGTWKVRHLCGIETLVVTRTLREAREWIADQPGVSSDAYGR